MSAPTPDALAAAAREARAYRNAIDHATVTLWGSQGCHLAALSAGDADDAAMWRDIAAADLRSRDFAATLYAAAFDRLAALRFAASPLRLVPCALTPDEAEALAVANYDLSENRAALAVWEDICDDDLAACAGQNAADARVQMRFDRDIRDYLLSVVHVCLDARAPLLAAQWEAAS